MPMLAYFEIVITLGEFLPYILSGLVGLLFIVQKKLRLWVFLAFLLVIPALVVLVIWDSRETAKNEGYDLSLPPLREMLETYITEGKGDMNEIIEGGKYAPIFGAYEIKRLTMSFLPMVLGHNTESDNLSDVPEAYNKGDDWFEATLGDPMIYTSGIYAGKNDNIWDAQRNKLKYIIDSANLNAGDKVLDIGCGWGRLLEWYADHGAKATGITLSSDQAAYGRNLNKHHGDNVKIVLENFMTVDFAPKSFNVISSVEMAEHVGIRNYQTFLKRVHTMLADDGTLYFQVAGLRLGHGNNVNFFEEHIWGLFMDEHVFPGADASCPMSWVTTQLEHAGFEVQRAQNLGWHYSQTLKHWQDEWEAKKSSISAKYGEASWRRWRVFLAWSVRIARRGGSSVFMFVATKVGQEAARVKTQDRLARQLDFDKMRGGKKAAKAAEKAAA